MTESGLAPRQQKLTATVPARVVGTASATVVIGEAPENMDVAEVTYAPNAAITGAATNHFRVRVINRGQSGAGTEVLAELAFDAGVTAAAGDERTIPLSATTALLDLDAGDVLAFESANVGTGMADPGGLLQVTLNRD